MRIENVPHDVPVANARLSPTTKIIAGRSAWNATASDETISPTKTDAPRLFVIAASVQANVRIRIGDTICLKPSVKHPMNSSNVRTPLYI